MEVALGPGAGHVEKPALLFDITAVDIAVIFINRAPMGEDIVFACDHKHGMEFETFGGMDRGQADASVLDFVVFIFATKGAVFQKLLYAFLALGYAEELSNVFQASYMAASSPSPA